MKLLKRQRRFGVRIGRKYDDFQGTQEEFVQVLQQSEITALKDKINELESRTA